MLEPWKEEPNELNYIEEGFRASILRNGMGCLCGYISVPSTHPWYGRHYDDIDAKVHGGLTYSNKDRVFEDLWQVGFDCAHAGDLIPMMAKIIDLPDDTYRDINFVKNEIRNLAEQALAACGT